MDKLNDTRSSGIDYKTYMRSPAWAVKREERMEFDGYKCVRCKCDDILEVHHVTYVRLGNEHIGDLETLCGKCHDEEHGITVLSSFDEYRFQQKFYRKIYVDNYGPFPHICYFCGAPVSGRTRPFNSTAAVIHHLDGNRENNHPSNLVVAHHGCHTAHHSRISGRAQVMQAALTLEQRRVNGRKGAAAVTPERRKEAGRKIAEAKTPEQASAAVRKQWDKLTPEERSARAHRIWEKRRKNGTATGWHHNDEARRKIREAGRGSRHTDKAREKMRNAAQLREVLTCPRCGQVIKGQPGYLSHVRACVPD